MDPDETMLEAEEAMEKGVEYLRHELRGIRTGRASAGLVEFVKVDAYGATSDLRSLAMITVPEPTQILIKPFDPSTAKEIAKGIERAGLGLNPMVDGKTVRLSVPPLSGDRRKQLSASVKAMGEQAKITIRNARRDANKALDQMEKSDDVSLSEDQVKGYKDDVQELVKRHEGQVETLVSEKIEDISTV
ncbi:ribosome recycling factor [Phycisphaera mikurensis]|uniref:Ribosome-recycling factor n=1 Tax=Phycisphaera mikurensis (strain NBRC 102666 / KCTC 22515 / FYK2301M01) TaxID=1142394 RepID=I0IGL1_PHYMF|nr:ribosome recycling factor [Phycisphaera mikurensis]MBB6442919.1 ribosome recycling factor [Phycisphaera mikurensis]BAM04399.1 ribosome-recycling factor [Phycisphaera mikurensis NBRC 102666]